MLVYRFEKKDGGGPFFTREGFHRLDHNVKSNHDYLYCCKSIKDLNNWFFSQFSQDQLSDCILKIYDIPDKDIKQINDIEYIFPKKYKPIN